MWPPILAERPAHRLRAGSWLVGVGCTATTTTSVFWPESSAVSEELRAWSALRHHDAACGACDVAVVGEALLDERRN